MMQELNYIRCGDYYIPDIRLPKESRSIGRFGRIHREYLMEHNPIRFDDLCLTRGAMDISSGFERAGTDPYGGHYRGNEGF